MIVYNEPDGKVKEEIEVSKMRLVEAPAEDEILNSTKSQTDLTIDGVQNMQTPEDYPYALTIYLSQRTMLLWVKSHVERSFWADALQEMIDYHR